MNELPPFRPHPLLRGGHLQTIAGAYWPVAKAPYRAVPHEVELSDGDRIVLHDDRPDEWTAGGGVVLLLHGVAGCHESPYLTRVARKLNDVGQRTFRMDLRGCGAGARLAQGLGHAGRSEDAAAATRRIQELCPGSAITVVGYSMGGNIALKLAGQWGANAPKDVAGVMAWNPPIDLACCGRNIDRGLSRIYSRSFSSSLTRLVRLRRAHNPRLAQLDLGPPPTSIVEFDDRVTAPLSGFRDVWDYYDQSSSAPLLERIRVPTWIVTSRDDPVIPVKMFERARISNDVRLTITDRGGHVAYLGALAADPDRWWMDWARCGFCPGRCF